MAIKSIRIGAVHHAADGTVQDFKTINAAKRQSRLLGGAAHVRAFDKLPSEPEMDRFFGKAAEVVTA